MVKLVNKNYKQLCKELKELQKERREALINGEDVADINDDINEIIVEMKNLKDLSYGYRKSDLEEAFGDLSEDEQKEVDRSLKKQFKDLDSVSNYIDIASNKIENEEDEEQVELSDSLIDKIRNGRTKKFKKALVGIGLIGSLVAGLNSCMNKNNSKTESVTPEYTYTDMNEFSDDTPVVEETPAVEETDKEKAKDSSWVMEFDNLKKSVEKEVDEVKEKIDNNINNSSNTQSSDVTATDNNDDKKDSKKKKDKKKKDKKKKDKKDKKSKKNKKNKKTKEEKNNKDNSTQNTTETKKEETTKTDEIPNGKHEVTVNEEKPPVIPDNMPIEETPSTPTDPAEEVYYDINGNPTTKEEADKSFEQAAEQNQNTEEKVEENTEEKVEENTEEKVEENTEEKVEENTEEKVEENTEEKVEESTEEKVEENTEEKVEESTEEKVEENTENNDKLPEIVEEDEEDITYYDGEGNEISKEQAKAEEESLLNQYKEIQAELSEMKSMMEESNQNLDNEQTNENNAELTLSM